MLREVSIFICVVGIACGVTVAPTPFKNKQSPGPPLASKTVYEDHDTVVIQPLNNVVSPPPKYLPSKISAIEVNNAIVDTITPAPVVTKTGHSNNSAKKVDFYSAGESYNPQSPANKHFSNDVSGDIKPFFGTPLEAKTVVIGSNGASYILPEAYANHVSALTYANNFVPLGIPQYATAAARAVRVESHGAVNVHPTAFANHRLSPAVTYVNSVAAVKPHYVPIVANNIVKSHEIITHHSPAVKTVNHVYNQPQTQYYPTVKSVAVSTIPKPAKTVTVERFNSVTAHPPQVPVQTIPVPVLYQAPAVETYHPSAQQVVVAKSISHPVPVLGARFNTIPVPVVHAPNHVENVYAPVGPASAVPPGHGYTRAVVYSPASEVSSVSFTGLGVNYGW